MTDVIIIGGGIVGLATAHAVLLRLPGIRVIVLEKEDRLGMHQTGRNSGVIHSGIYYKPGSLKAKFCMAGNLSMVAFIKEHNISHDICGKVIVATETGELTGLESLYQRGLQHGLAVRRLTIPELHEIEPNCSGIAALHVPSTGIVNYREVAVKLASLVQKAGGEIRTGSKVTSIRKKVIDTTAGTYEAKQLINCGGLYSDRMAKLACENVNTKIIPFRGEYYTLKPEKSSLVKALIYPVPNPLFPFLGVHCTRMIDGSVHLGPNAVLAFSREGYNKMTINLRDLAETLMFPGFWRMVRSNWRDGIHEIERSFSRACFVRSLQRLVPAITADDVVPCAAGVRAQALHASGALEDDFLIIEKPGAIHILNAPSPAATASLEIGKTVAGLIQL
jgi:L-2-hydroxyglutarate oxidase